jgi:hypothetical protein
LAREAARMSTGIPQDIKTAFAELGLASTRCYSRPVLAEKISKIRSFIRKRRCGLERQIVHEKLKTAVSRLINILKEAIEPPKVVEYHLHAQVTWVLDILEGIMQTV